MSLRPWQISSDLYRTLKMMSNLISRNSFWDSALYLATAGRTESFPAVAPPMVTHHWWVEAGDCGSDSLLEGNSSILALFAKVNKLTLFGTCLIFFGTFKSHESHCNKHILKCYRRPVTECSFCMHSYNHIYHYESIACLGVSIPFFTNAISSVWHRKYRIFLLKSGFLQCCKVCSGISL